MSGSFQDELNYLKDVAREHARLNPKLEKYFGASSTDPDVEHLMEGFAFLTSRVREKIEDEIPELTNALIERIWPSFLRAFPPAAIARFSPIDKAITERQVIRRGLRMLSGPNRGAASIFRTTADCVVYPLEIGDLRAERTRDGSLIELDFATLSGLPLSGIGLDRLRLNFCGSAEMQQALYLWICRYLTGFKLKVRERGKTYSLPLEMISPAALGPEEALLGDGDSFFDGYRLLQEFFRFPEKFHAVDVAGLRPFIAALGEREFSLAFEFRRPLPPDIKLERGHIQLYCVPIVNLFDNVSQPLKIGKPGEKIALEPKTAQMSSPEIFSVDNVGSAAVEAAKGAQRYIRFESHEHVVEQEGHRSAIYWRHLRMPALGQRREQHALAFVHGDGQPASPHAGSILATLTCFDGDAPTRLAPGSIANQTVDAPSFVTFTNLTAPTAPIYPPTDGSLGWQLISNLSLNFQSLNSRDAFSAIVSTYDYRALQDRQVERRAAARAQGLVSIETRPSDRLFKGVSRRGLRTVMKLRESAFASEGEMQLYATILSEFLTLYATVNSFHQLEVIGVENNETILFPAKPGRQPLI